MIDLSEIKAVIEQLDEEKIRYYINSGFALHLRGIEGELGDCDIRIFSEDLNPIFFRFKQTLPFNMKLRSSKDYRSGKYLSDCIEIKSKTNFDIYSRMRFQCDFGEFEFPFSRKVFDDIDLVSYEGFSFPVASPENLLLYYLVLRRGPEDRKNDEQRIKDLLAFEEFDHSKFQGFVSRLPRKDHILSLYEERK